MDDTLFRSSRHITYLSELPLPQLSEASDAILRRARAFLFGVSREGFWTKAVLQGYTESTHQTGVLLFSIGTSERTFAEWRAWAALRPVYDPDLPELVEKLSAFRERWQPRALEALSAIEDEEDREEVRGYLGVNEERPSRTWTAKSFVARLRGMQKVPLYRPAWNALVANGFLEELPAFERALEDVQDFIRNAPVDAKEFLAIVEAREKAISDLNAWLADRKKEIVPALTEADLVVLGFGDLVPPAFSGRSAFLIQRIEISAKA